MKYRKYFLNDKFFDKWSPSMAYTLGFIFTDGGIYHNTVSIWLQAGDKYLLENLKHTLKATYPLKYHTSITEKGTLCKSYELSFNSSYMVKRLLTLGVLYDKKHKRFPLPKIPLKYFSHFVRGVFDGDGSIYDSQIDFYGNDLFLLELNAKLCALLDVPKVTIKNYPGSFGMSYYTKSVRKIGNFMYHHKGNLFLKRKYIYFKNYKKRVEEYWRKHGRAMYQL